MYEDEDKFDEEEEDLDELGMSIKGADGEDEPTGETLDDGDDAFGSDKEDENLL
jgi:hypothetical protein